MLQIPRPFGYPHEFERKLQKSARRFSDTLALDKIIVEP